MYFNNKNNTNIDNEFNDNDLISNILSIISKYKLIILIVIILLIAMPTILYFVNNRKDNYKIILSGENTITIYKDSEYIDPGYKVYDSNGEEYNGKISIISTLDTKIIGEYEIMYSLGDVSKTRKIVVIDKPKEYVYIYLTPVNNSTHIYLKTGDTYKEPGYKVLSTTGKDLTGSVKVIGTVDTKTPGTYKLTYSITDDNGVTTSETRNVIVMNTEISLSLNNQEYTNKEVIINVGVIDNYFDYMILPNGEKRTTSSYEYKVTSNGKYTFKAYNKKGNVKEASIEIKNIDKLSPTGSCNGSYSNGKSIVNVNSNDSSGIDKYMINGISYSNSPININSELKTVNITIYDKAGNTKNISCDLENKNSVSKPSSSKASLSSKPSSSASKPSSSKPSSSKGSFSSYKIQSVDVSNLNCDIVYGTSTTVNKISINSLVADDFYSILKSTCNYVNSSPYVDNIQHAGAYVNREGGQHDYHAKGTAIDLYNLWSYTHNGKTYKPYSSQGYSTWNNYKKFICDVCDGKEDCKYNINYVIYNRFFKPKGWCWGGNYGPQYFDPMHFELREDNCQVKNKAEISCPN